MRKPSPYLMRDLNGDKVQDIMNFNVALKRHRSRSVFEISIFLFAVAGYLLALAATT
ncbi:MAG: hypothetical protein KDI88_16525 [Gammaproteobacteria bacterium]|nr:hypothetical protein [Gammaproteobacteria bacterium]